MLATTIRVLVAGCLDGATTGGLVGLLVAGTLSGLQLHLGYGAIVDMAIAALVILVVLGVPMFLLHVFQLLLGGMLLRASGLADARRDPSGHASRGAERLRSAAGRMTTTSRMAGATIALLVVFVLLTGFAGPQLKLVAPGLLPLLVLGVLTGSLLGGVLAIRASATAHASDFNRRLGRGRRAAAGGLMVAALALVAGSAAWAAMPGMAPALQPAPPVAAVDGVDLPDPGQPGSFAVTTTSYGSEPNDRRPEFGPSAPIRTEPIDASAALRGYGDPVDAFLRWRFGHGLEALGRNALVWAPVGDGPFPLVLIVHGNHALGHDSDPGYAYMGDHLASRGFIVASVDEAMLNGFWGGDFEGREMAVRAWVLTQHLATWRALSSDPASPFAGMVDLGRVALVGHSRGGEAVALAARLARMDRAPAPGFEPWVTGVSVRAVVAIAPSEGIGAAAGMSGGRLEETDYLALVGGHDADTTSFLGLPQYGRTDVVTGGGGLKAAAWIRRANHGQFNSEWGLGDVGPFGEYALERGPLLAAEAQRDVARTLIGGFLEASLMGREGYRAMFAVPALGREWLPADVVVTRSWAAGDGIALTFERAPEPEQGDATEAPVAGPSAVTWQAEGGAAVSIVDVPLRGGGYQGNRAAAVRWTPAAQDPALSVTLPAGSVGVIGDDAVIRFALAAARPGLDGLEVQVALADERGAVAEVPLSRYGGLPPLEAIQLHKRPDVATALGLGTEPASPAEVVLQTFAIPVRDLGTGTARLDPAGRVVIRFTFSGLEEGAVYLDEIGLDEEEAAGG